MAVTSPEKLLSDQDRDYILSLKSEDICMSLLMKFFAKPSAKEPSRFQVNDYFKLPTSRFNTKREVYTTIGIYLINLHLIQPHFAEIFGYINKPFNGDVIKSIEAKLSELLYYDKINADDMADWYNRLQWLGNEKMSVISPTITQSILKPIPGLMAKKDKLFKENEKDLKPSNPSNAIVGSKIEKELVTDATNYLEIQDGYENFASKAKININNNYKTMNIMKGPLPNLYDGGYNVNKSEYNTGISKDEYTSLADSSVLGGYSRAVNTAVGGYQAKQFNQGGGALSAGPKGSDCKTEKTLSVYIYPEMTKDYLNRYIVDKGVLKELTPENIGNYVNTTVNMRSPMYCKYKEPCYCNICIGNQPYLMDLKNFGLTLSKIPSTVTQLSMKKFHDLTIKTVDISVDELFDFD